MKKPPVDHLQLLIFIIGEGVIYAGVEMYEKKSVLKKNSMTNMKIGKTDAVDV
jgi:hypothetical protein